MKFKELMNEGKYEINDVLIHKNSNKKFIISSKEGNIYNLYPLNGHPNDKNSMTLQSKNIDSFFKKTITEGMGISTQDQILNAITYEELIDTIQSNESVIDEKTVKRVYKEILKFKLSEAEYELKKNMKKIIEMAK